MRLFKSPWAYLFWLALFLDQIWHELHPRTHPALPPWHPLFNAITLTFADIFCIGLAFSLARLTSNALEKGALALLAVTFALSTVVDIHTLGHFHTPLPSFRLVFLSANTLLALLTAIRFIQVLCELPPRVLRRSPSQPQPRTTNH